MLVLRAATVLAMAILIATPVLAQQGDKYDGFGEGYDTGDLAPGYELPGAFPATPEREQVTPFGEVPGGGRREQDAPINVVGGQTETFERGIIGDALNRGKSALIRGFRRDNDLQN